MTKREILILVGSNIKKIRKCKGISALDLAAQCEIGIGEFNKIEKGRIEVPMSIIDKITAALGVELRDLMTR